MSNKYRDNGAQYAPNMEMERERCTECGLTHMVQYRVVEVTEEGENGNFNWKIPENVSKLRIIIDSSVDNAARYAESQPDAPARAYATPVAQRSLPPLPPHRDRIDVRITPPPPLPNVWMDEEFVREAIEAPAEPPHAAFSATLASIRTRRAAEEEARLERAMREFQETQALDNASRNPYNAPTGDIYAQLSSNPVPVQDSVGSADGSTFSSRMDDSVRGAVSNLRAYRS